MLHFCMSKTLICIASVSCQEWTPLRDVPLLRRRLEPGEEEAEEEDVYSEAAAVASSWMLASSWH